MVIYFNKKDLIQFGNYLLSNERKKLFTESYKQKIKDGINNPLPVDEVLKMVHHSDVANFIDSKRK